MALRARGGEAAAYMSRPTRVGTHPVLVLLPTRHVAQLVSGIARHWRLDMTTESARNARSSRQVNVGTSVASLRITA
jgi:hypothetical protein